MRLDDIKSSGTLRGSVIVCIVCLLAAILALAIPLPRTPAPTPSDPGPASEREVGAK